MGNALPPGFRATSGQGRWIRGLSDGPDTGAAALAGLHPMTALEMPQGFDGGRPEKAKLPLAASRR